MRKIRVSLKQGRSYEIWVGSKVLKKLPTWIRSRRYDQVFAFVDRRVLKAAQPYLRGIPIKVCTATEDFKSLKCLEENLSWLAEQGANRHSLVVAIGGGVIGDAVGFAASVYGRGVDWVSVPTTLLGQVDSGIGGKTAVNLARGKNLAGTFHQPKLVICEGLFLKTLPLRDQVSGMGEVVKYGLIYDQSLLMCLFNSKASLSDVVGKCVAHKARVVSQDELDRKGFREVLNFGHTFGHALETLTGYSKYRHGEAVLYGMMFAVRLSKYRGHLPPDEAGWLLGFLNTFRLPPLDRRIRVREILRQFGRDKKVKSGRIRFVLLKGIGKAILDHQVSESLVRKVLREMGLK